MSGLGVSRLLVSYSRNENKGARKLQSSKETLFKIEVTIQTRNVLQMGDDRSTQGPRVIARCSFNKDSGKGGVSYKAA